VNSWCGRGKHSMRHHETFRRHGTRNLCTFGININGVNDKKNRVRRASRATSMVAFVRTKFFRYWTWTSTSWKGNAFVSIYRPWNLKTRRISSWTFILYNLFRQSGYVISHIHRIHLFTCSIFHYAVNNRIMNVKGCERKQCWAIPAFVWTETILQESLRN
jgi:hypothetical protein